MGDWKAAALYGGLGLFVACLIWRWHKSKHFENFCLLHAFTTREGYYDPDRVHLTGSFLVCTFAVVISVIRNAVTLDVAMLVGGYASVFAMKQAWTYTVSKRTDTDVKTAEIERGRRSDSLAVEEEEQLNKRTSRRRRDDKILG